MHSILISTSDVRRCSEKPSPIRLLLLLAAAVSLVWCGGCATPDIKDLSATTILQPDEEDNIGGTFLESGDIRTIATKMSGALLSTPEIGKSETTVQIAIAPIRNSTRFIMDKEIFMKRLRIELNKVGSGRIRFLSQDAGQETRSAILQDQDEDTWAGIVDEAAGFLVGSAAIASAKEPPNVAVIPIRNTNLVGLNADSFTAMIRGKMAEKGAGKVMFLAREKNGKVIEEILDEKDIKNLGLAKTKQLKSLYGVDYFLGGEFVAESLMAESTVTSVEKTVAASKDDPGIVESKVTQKTEKPNVNKFLNIMLIDAETGVVNAEKMVKVESKMKSGLGKSNYILTGELSALSKAAEGGTRSDYIILSFQLVDPKSNVVLWEDAYETKKKSTVSAVYR